MYARSIDINAAPAAVWSVLSDVEGWPQWTPSTLRVRREDDGALRIGSSAVLQLRGRPGESRWTVTAVEHGRSFVWQSPSGPGLRVIAGHEIEPVGEGSRVRLWLRAAGPLGWLFDPLVARMVRANVDAEAEGLKSRCERSQP